MEELGFYLSNSDSDIGDSEEEYDSVNEGETEDMSTLLKRCSKDSELGLDDLAELYREVCQDHRKPYISCPAEGTPQKGAYDISCRKMGPSIRARRADMRSTKLRTVITDARYRRRCGQEGTQTHLALPHI